MACVGATLSVAQYLEARVRRPRLCSLDDLGTSELEFALAFPIFLVSVLVTVQMALMVNATLIVDYAAFCAARSAAVWIPQSLPGEGENAITDPGDREHSEKWTRIRHAVSIACLPISSRLTGFVSGFLARPVSPPVDEATLAELARIGSPQPNRPPAYLRMGRDAIDKWLYSELYTSVELLDVSGQPRTQFPEDTPITATITHHFFMNVPLAGALMGSIFGDRFAPFIGPYYIPLTASYTLMVSHA